MASHMIVYNLLFKLTSKETRNLHIIGFVRGTTSDCWLPLAKDQVTRKIFLWHDVTILSCHMTSGGGQRWKRSMQWDGEVITCIWRHWTTKMLFRYMLPNVCLRLRQFSQLSFVQYMGLCVFSLPNSPVMIVRMCTLSYHHHQIISLND